LVAAASASNELWLKIQTNTDVFLLAVCSTLSETLHLPNLHLYRSATAVKSCMLHVQQQQQLVLHAHSNVCECTVFAVGNLGTFSAAAAA